jgi:hypothetical protein
MILCSMLPQTTYKIWGIKNVTFKAFYQFEYISRHKGWENDSESIYKLNQMICSFNGINEIKFISTKSKIKIDQGVYDEQIFNRIHNFPGLKIEGDRIAISYTLDTHNLTNYSDLKYGLEGLRNIYRNYRFFRKNRLDSVYSVIFPWNKYMETREKLFWKNNYIYSHDLKQKSIHFIEANLRYFPEIIQMKKQHKTLLINPTINMKLEDFIFFVEKHPSFFTHWTNTCIFIKHHRTSDSKFPQEFKVGKNHFYTILSELTFLLPTEIIYYSIDNIKVLTTTSSLVALNRNIVAQKPLRTVDEKNYNLMLKQLEKFREFEWLS